MVGSGPGLLGAAGCQLILFCDVIFRVFNKGGFFIDDEKAKPLRKVALWGICWLVFVSNKEYFFWVSQVSFAMVFCYYL